MARFIRIDKATRNIKAVHDITVMPVPQIVPEGEEVALLPDADQTQAHDLVNACNVTPAGVIVDRVGGRELPEQARTGQKLRDVAPEMVPGDAAYPPTW